MTDHRLLRRGVLALTLSLATLPAWSGDDCDAPVARWQSREAVRQMAARQGWQIQRLKIDDGCYELRGTDAQGRSFKAKIDPETLAVVKMKAKDHQRDQDHQRDRDRDRAHTAPKASGAPPTPASTPGTAPRGRTP